MMKLEPDQIYDSFLACKAKNNYLFFYRQGREIACIDLKTNTFSKLTKTEEEFNYAVEAYREFSNLLSAQNGQIERQGISELEERFKGGLPLEEKDLIKLIKILIDERDCFLSISKVLNKSHNELEKIKSGKNEEIISK